MGTFLISVDDGVKAEIWIVGSVKDYPLDALERYDETMVSRGLLPRSILRQLNAAGAITVRPAS